MNIYPVLRHSMMMSSNGKIFRVTGHLCGDFTGPGDFPTQRPVTRSFDVFNDLRLNKPWFETLLRPLWRHCNGFGTIMPCCQWTTIEGHRLNRSIANHTKTQPRAIHEMIPCTISPIVERIEADTEWPPFADNIYNCVVLNENWCILIAILLKFVTKSPIKNRRLLVKIIAWCRTGNNYCQTFNISGALVGKKMFDRSDVFRCCSNYIFILDLTPGFKILHKDNCTMRRETFKFWDSDLY